MVLPNFICLGVGKAGTTSLHYLLRQHPDVLLVPEKEANFFSDEENYAKGLDWYAEKFSAYNGQRVIGDITPSYFYKPVSFERIAECCGTDIKLILIFRQPVRRAFSHYLHHVRLFETNQPFLNDLEGEDNELRTVSTYSERLRQLLDVFPRKNVLVMNYERHIAHGKLAVGYIQVARLLGLGVHPMDFNVHMTKAFIPVVSFIDTLADAARFPGLGGVKPGDIVVETVRDSDSSPEAELISSPSAETVTWHQDFVANITRSLAPDEIRAITQRHFAADIGTLRGLLQDELPEWDV